jgi:hypothetical protein
LTDGTPFDHFTIEHDFEGIGHRIVNISGRLIPAGIVQPALVLMQIEDITGNSHG